MALAIECIRELMEGQPRRCGLGIAKVTAPGRAEVSCLGLGLGGQSSLWEEGRGCALPPTGFINTPFPRSTNKPLGAVKVSNKPQEPPRTVTPSAQPCPAWAPGPLGR